MPRSRFFLTASASRGTRLVTGDDIGRTTVGTGCILELSRTHGADAYPWLAPGDVVTCSNPPVGEIVARIRPATSAADPT